MRKMITAAALGAMLLTAPALEAKPRMTPEQKLDRILKDRTAGEPVDCINLNDTRNSTIIDKTAIVYDAGRVIYVNRPTNATSLDDDDVMVNVVRGTSQLCSVDTVRLLDRTTRFESGFVGLGKFVPYRKVASAN